MEHPARLYKTLTQLRRWPLADLQALAEGLETLRAERAREEAAPVPGTAGRLTLRQAYVCCGKPGCHCVADDDPGHGPYWYAYRKQGGKVVSTYLGKQLDRLPDTATATPAPKSQKPGIRKQQPAISVTGDDQEALWEAIATVGQSRLSFVRIHRVRAALGWPSARFDRALEAARRAQTIELHGGDPSQFTAAELADSYSDALGQYLALSWVAPGRGRETPREP
jgi:hypothetical protein